MRWPLAAVEIELTYEPGDSVVSFQFEADQGLEHRAEAIAHVLREGSASGDVWELRERVLRREDPVDRAEAVRWARSLAGQIVNGEFDDPALGLFDVAQRMEWMLTRWQWLDSEFPRAIAPFVLGWNNSGAETEAAIRHAAATLVADGSGDGPQLRPHR